MKKYNKKEAPLFSPLWFAQREKHAREMRRVAHYEGLEDCFQNVTKCNCSKKLKYCKQQEDAMNKYLDLMDKAEQCEKTALKLLHKKQTLLAIFYKNAAIGYKKKANKLNIQEVEE